MSASQQLNFQLMEPGDDPLCDQFIDILRQALQPDSETPLDIAIQQILKLLPEGQPYSHDVRRFLETCYEAAEQIPYSHPSMAKLVTIIEQCLNSSRFDASDKQYGRGNRFQMLKDSSFDWWNSSTPLNDPEKYVNFQTFLARIDERGILEGPELAIYCMREAFDQNRGASKEQRDAYAKAAALWLLVHVEEIHQKVLQSETKTSRGRVQRHDWDSWHERFRTVASMANTASEDCVFSEDTIELAGRAAAAMEAAGASHQQKSAEKSGKAEKSTGAASEKAQETRQKILEPTLNSGEVTELIKRTAMLMEQTETAQERKNVEESSNAKKVTTTESKEPDGANKKTAQSKGRAKASSKGGDGRKQACVMV